MNTKENYKRWIAKNHARRLLHASRYNKKRSRVYYYMDDFPHFIKILEETKPIFSIRYPEGGINPFL
jgi:hypothetical protein